jgi:hypothetical protein
MNIDEFGWTVWTDEGIANQIRTVNQTGVEIEQSLGNVKWICEVRAMSEGEGEEGNETHSVGFHPKWSSVSLFF